MKVTNGISNKAAELATGSVSAEGLSKSRKTNKGPSDTGAAGATRVDVSARAMEMKRAQELATPSNDIDEAKVARLQKLIDDGKYKVDAEKVAERLLDEHLKMPT